MFDFTTKINSRLTADLHCTDSDVDRILMKNENRKLVLVGGKNGSNQKMSENKKFLIISVNLNPKCQVPNPKIAFYQNTLLKIVILSCYSSPSYIRSNPSLDLFLEMDIVHLTQFRDIKLFFLICHWLKYYPPIPIPRLLHRVRCTLPR